MTDSTDAPAGGPFALFQDLDRLLRGRYTSEEALRDGRIEFPARRLIFLCIGLGAFYGALMGLYSVTTREEGEGWMQVFASAVKVPLLFLLTLIVTCPSLYVVSALARSRLKASATLRLLLAAIAVDLALLASLGPVTGFFTLSTDSYPFMKLLNVLFFGAAGIVGVGFLQRALRTILEPEVVHVPEPQSVLSAEGDDESESESERIQFRQAARMTRDTEASMRRVFRVWIVIFGVVGAQMGWILRPFIGSPGEAFSWFRDRESNILVAIFKAIGDLAQ